MIKELIEAAVAIEGGTVESTGKIDTGTAENSIAAFLTYMAPRLIEMYRILKPTGSIFLHCDPSANAYLRLMLDAIFGRKNFRNEIVWCYTGPANTKSKFPQKHDTVFFYVRSDKAKFYKDAVRIPYAASTVSRSKYGGKPAGDMPFHSREINSDGKVPEDWWSDIVTIKSLHSERTGWRTQKPLKLYERIIKAASKEGDLVLDPFCGCATTCVAAERLQRQWVGIDIDPVARKVTQDRLRETAGIDQLLDDEWVTVKETPPKRTDIPKVKNDEIRELLWRRQGFKCFNGYCDSGMLRKVDVQIDHLIPKSRGGADDILNRIGLCGDCNRRKGVKSWGAFLDYERMRQPHPVVPIVNVQ